MFHAPIQMHRADKALPRKSALDILADGLEADWPVLTAFIAFFLILAFMPNIAG